MTVSFLGAGNVAHHLIRAMIENTFQIKQIYNRSIDKAAALGEPNNIEFTNNIEKLEKVDLFVIAAADDAIEEISSQILYKDTTVVHTSGTSSINALKGEYKKGVIYPLQTFSKNRILNYGEIPFFLEGENQEIFKALKNIVKRISTKVYELNSEDRKRMHLSAVFVCNFVNFMYSTGQEIVEKADLDFSVLRPLIKETALKAMDFEPQEVQTGPAVRGDKKTISAHLELLKNLPIEREIYELLSNAIENKYNEL